MSEQYRLPDGEIIDKDDLDPGRECGRCGSFIPMTPAEQPKPEVQRYRLTSEGLAVTDNSKSHHTTRGGGADLEITLCPDCQKDLIRFANNDLAGGDGDE